VTKDVSFLLKYDKKIDLKRKEHNNVRQQCGVEWSGVEWSVQCGVECAVWSGVEWSVQCGVECSGVCSVEWSGVCSVEWSGVCIV
jgi:hypothetical protein